MKQWFMIGAIGIGLLLGTPNAPLAQTSTEERLKQLEQEVQQLKDQSLKSESSEIESSSKISIHGYGEMHYNDPVVEGTGLPIDDLNPTLDFHRLVFGWSWQYNDRLSLHTELDFEHAAQELELEFAYLDYRWTDAINVRAGSILVPVGYLNEYHEPPNFFSVERPYVQKYIIPTTWGAGGVGLFGQPLLGLKYSVYFVEGLDASGFSANGIKDGRQLLFEDTNKASDFGGVGRLEYTGLPGLAAGASFYSAGAAQDDPNIKQAQVTLWEADLQYRLKGFYLTGLYATSRISDAEQISAKVGETVGSEQVGWYLEGAYDFLRLMAPESDQSIVVFVRYENFDTQKKVPSGFTADPAYDRRVITYGLAYYPHPDVAIKIDQERWEDEADNKEKRLNAGIAYMF